MANSNDLPPFDDEYQSQIKTTLNETVDYIQEKMCEAQSLSVEDAERMLDEACADCVKTFQTKLNEIKTSVRRAKPDTSSPTYYETKLNEMKTSVKRVKPDTSSPTYDEDKKKYRVYVEATARGIERSKSLFDKVVQRIRDIVTMVIDCIKAGVDWIWSQLTEAFAAVR